MSRTDLYSYLKEWEQLTPLPFYSIGEPELTKVVNKGGEEFFVLKVLVSNNSDYDGIIQMNVLQNGWWYQPMEDPRARKKVEIAAIQAKNLFLSGKNRYVMWKSIRGFPAIFLI